MDFFSSLANRCGFNSDTYFNTLFKKHFQQTPLEYRDSSRHR
ncbi:AraC family transcriptional regulator [Companilactobacillus huachuanensis]